MSHGGAMRYSYPSGNTAPQQPQPQQQCANGNHLVGGTGSGKPTGQTSSIPAAGPGGRTISTGQATMSGSLAQQQQASPPVVPSLPFMRPPMLVTSSGASMLLPPPCPQSPQSMEGDLPKYPGFPIGSLSGSDTDVSTSNENLSREERYVLSHARVEPQGEENLQGSVTPVNEMQARFIGDKFSSNTSSDSTRYATPTGGSNSSRSISESRTGGVLMYANVSGTSGGCASGGGGNGADSVPSNRSSMVGTGSNRNSLKESNSNRSSMDVSQSSYNTLIIHDDIYSSVTSSARDYAASPPPYMMKKERPRSYGEAVTAQVTPMQDITEITEEYINQSHVLKHLAKEVKIVRGPTTRSHDSHARDSGVLSENNRHWIGSFGGSRQQSTISTPSTERTTRVEEEKMAKGQKSGGGVRIGSEVGCGGAGAGNGKLKSKSQPDLTRLYDIDPEEVEVIVKENHLLKQQLNNCYLKVAKSQKLEQEIANIYRVHEELVQSCDRRERLERAARTRLQQDCRRLQELNRAFRDQVEVYQNQLHASSDHQLGRTQQDVLISQLVNQNKSLVDANRRQCIELQAQNATLEEQRIHINVLDTALKRLEEECRQKQVYVERCAQLQHALQSLQNASERREQAERKLRIDYDNDLPNRSGSSTTSDTDNLKWQLREKDAQILRLETECAKMEQRNLEESNVRNVAKLTMERNSQETERILAEAKQEKIRYLDEAHASNRKVTELQTRLKLVENRLAEKDAMIRAYQGQKIYGGSTNSYGSYNLSTDSFALNPLGAYNSQTSYVDVPSNSFDVTTNAAGSLLDPSVVVGSYGVGTNVGAVAAAAAVSSYASTYGPTNSSSFVQSSLNLPTVAGTVGSGPPYSSPSSSSTSNYSSANFGTSGLVGTGSEHTIYDSKSYDAQRKSIDDQLKQLDEQLLSKVSERSMVEKQHQLNQRARALAAKLKASVSGGGSSGLGTASNTSSASSSVDSNGNLLHVGRGISTNHSATTTTRQSPASSTSSGSTANIKQNLPPYHRQGGGGAGKMPKTIDGSARVKKLHHHSTTMAKTTSTPAISLAGKKSSNSSVGTASVGTNTTVSGAAAAAGVTNDHGCGKKLAASCKNVSTSATDSSGSSSSEPETFY